MGACSSKSTSNIADPVMQSEQISAPADTAAVVATPDVAPAETPAADAAAAPSTVTPEAEEPAAEEPKEEAAAEDSAAEEAPAEAADEVPPPTEPVKSSSILGQVVDYLSGRKSEPAVEETEAVETAEADAPAAEAEQPVARSLTGAVDAVAQRDDAEQEEARVEWRAYALAAGEAGLAREMSVTPEELAEVEARLAYSHAAAAAEAAEAAEVAAPEPAAEAAPEAAPGAAPEAAPEAAVEAAPAVAPEEEEGPPTLIQKLSKAFSSLLPAAPKCMPSRPALDEEPADSDTPAPAEPAAAQWGTKRISQQHWK